MRFLCNQTCIDSSTGKTYKFAVEYAMTESEAKNLFEAGHLTKFLAYERKYRFEPMDGEARGFQDDCFQGKIDSSNIPIEGTIAEGALDIPGVDTDKPEPIRRGRKPNRRGRKPKHAEEA